MQLMQFVVFAFTTCFLRRPKQAHDFNFTAHHNTDEQPKLNPSRARGGRVHPDMAKKKRRGEMHEKENGDVLPAARAPGARKRCVAAC